ncbi:MAG: hypothetical protein SF187_27495 [Deltaproteobacteria bacterium]|nr:hypothetical protein [Deltaproteobacteria bacterium]
MKRFARWTVVSTLVLSPLLASSLPGSRGSEAHAAPKKAAKAAKPAKAAAAPPNANAEEINKLKGEFKWGMPVEEVQKGMEQRVRDSYAEELKKAIKDPTQYARKRSEIEKEVKAIKANYVKFEGKKTGYDSSIVDQEFAHKTDESMLTSRDDKNTRYYFFVDGKLYKIFTAFSKEVLQDKSFTDFGELMQARFGKAKQVMVEEKTKAGVSTKLDHYEWSSASGDGLRLVDRSEFYDVYCLVIYDRKVADALAQTRERVHPHATGKDSLVEAALTGDRSGDDVNANIIDQIAGKDYAKPGAAPADIVVPSPSGVAPTAAQVNAGSKKETGGGKKSGATNSKKSASDELEL